MHPCGLVILPSHHGTAVPMAIALGTTTMRVEDFSAGIFFLVQGLKQNAGLKLKIHRIHVVDFWVDFCQGDDGGS